MYKGILIGALIMPSCALEPNFTTPQGVDVYLDGVQVDQKRMAEAIEIVLQGLSSKQEAEMRLNVVHLNVLFQDHIIKSSVGNAYGSYLYSTIKIYAHTPCVFDSSLAHEFTHYTLDMLKDNPDADHSSDYFCTYDEHCYERFVRGHMVGDLCK